MNKPRVVVTGLGVVAPNAVGSVAFENALRNTISGIRYIPQLAELQFGCQVGGIPPLTQDILEQYFSPVALKSLKSTGVIYGVIAGVDAWRDAGLMPAPDDSPHWESGCIMGTGMTGVEALRDGFPLVDEGNVKRLGSRLIEQSMASSVSAHLGGKLGLGNQVSTNASACSTGTEALLLAYQRIVSGQATRILAGGCDSGGPYVWGGFDSMRVLCRKYNDKPEQASRPLSESAAGFVPGSGAGALVLETLESALERGAHIYAEILGGAVNSGGQRGRGSMTAPNPEGIVRCIRMALDASGTKPSEIDAIDGHLTATLGDPIEVASWSEALGRKGHDFPYLHSLKSMTGHCLSAAGAIECAAVVLQLHSGFFHPTLNCEDLHPDISRIVAPDRIPQHTLTDTGFRTIIKANFGFGDVNAVVVIRRFDN